jgi:hypothetical protein
MALELFWKVLTHLPNQNSNEKKSKQSTPDNCCPPFTFFLSALYAGATLEYVKLKPGQNNSYLELEEFVLPCTMPG